MWIRSSDMFVSLEYAGPDITVQVIQDLEMQLTELMTRLVETCTTEEFCVMMRLVLQGLEVSNIWKQNPKVGNFWLISNKLLSLVFSPFFWLEELQ